MNEQFETKEVEALYRGFMELVGFLESKADGMMKIVWRSAKAALGDNFAEYFRALDENEGARSELVERVALLVREMGFHVIPISEDTQVLILPATAENSYVATGNEATLHNEGEDDASSDQEYGQGDDLRAAGYGEDDPDEVPGRDTES